MNRYLIDRDVLSELEDPNGNRNVHAWVNGVPDSALYISAITVMESRKGIARGLARARNEDARRKALAREAWFRDLLAAFADRIVPVDQEIGIRWGEMLAERETHIMDTSLAATAAVCGFVVATRNVDDYRGRGVQLVDPFAKRPQVTATVGV